jgi:TrmH family RNA methyltransferase
LRLPVQHITSRQNPIVARYRAARERKADTDPVLLDGIHLVREALDANVPLRDVVVARDSDGNEMRDLLARLARARVELRSASSAVMSALSPVRSSSPVVALTDAPDLDGDAAVARLFERGLPLVVIGHCIQDPGNVGAIVRVAEAAGATGVVVGTASADPFGWKAVRASMGSVLRLPLAADTNQGLDAARHRGCRIFALVPEGGRSPFEVDLRGQTAIVIGGEGAGLPPGLEHASDEKITIPMQPPVGSLNVAVSAAVVLYEARRQRTNPQSAIHNPQ